MNKLIRVKTGLSVLVAAVIAVASVVVHAADGPYDKAIQARQAMFQTMGFNIGVLAAMAKEKVPYDAAVASEAASNIDAAANFGQSQMWPPGSDSETDGNATNRALPALWENFPDVGKKGEALTTASAAMVAAAGEGLGVLQGAMGDLGGSCKGCHDDYRAERK